MNELKRQNLVEQFENIISDYEQRQLSEIDVELNYEDLQCISECLQFAQLKTKKLEREENKPLTIEELRGMVGEPVWVSCSETIYDMWDIVRKVEDVWGGTFKVITDDNIHTSEWNNFYKHKPKGDDLHE